MTNHVDPTNDSVASMRESLKHPPYVEMIHSAIVALNEQDGSSKIAIANYIKGAFLNLPRIFSSLLTHQLTRMKKHGLIIMENNLYKLPNPELPISDDNNCGIVNGEDTATQPFVEPEKGDNCPVGTGQVVTPQPSNDIVIELISSPTSIGDVIVPDTTPLSTDNVGPQPASDTNDIDCPPNNGSILGKRGRGRPPKNRTLGSKKIPNPKRSKKNKGVKQGGGQSRKARVSTPPLDALVLISALTIPNQAEVQVDAPESVDDVLEAEIGRTKMATSRSEVKKNTTAVTGTSIESPKQNATTTEQRGTFFHPSTAHSSLVSDHLTGMKKDDSVMVENLSYKLPRSSDFPIFNNNNNCSIVNNDLPPPLPFAVQEKDSNCLIESSLVGPEQVVPFQPTNNVVIELADSPTPIDVVTVSDSAPLATDNIVLQPASVTNDMDCPVMEGFILEKRGRGRPLKNGPLGPKKSPDLTCTKKHKGVKRGGGHPHKARASTPPLDAPIIVSAPTMPIQAEVQNDATENVDDVPNEPEAEICFTKKGASRSDATAPEEDVLRTLKNLEIKKNTTTVGAGTSIQSPKQNATTYGREEERGHACIKRLIKFYQERVKIAVEVLKPHFSLDRDICTVAAIQQLQWVAAHPLD